MSRPLSRRLLRFANFAFLFVAVLAISSHVGLLQLFGKSSNTSRRSSGRSRRSSSPARPTARRRTPWCSSTARTCRPSKRVEDWKVQDGCVIADKHDIETKQAFGDCQLHVEWAAPEKVVGSGQGRGNSGVFMMGHYEIQILDSYDNDTYYDGQCAGIYKQHPPMVNACRKPGEWQTYDIIWEAPQFDKQGKLLKPAYVTVLQNGVVVQNHFELPGATS